MPYLATFDYGIFARFVSLGILILLETFSTFLSSFFTLGGSSFFSLVANELTTILPLSGEFSTLSYSTGTPLKLMSISSRLTTAEATPSIALYLVVFSLLKGPLEMAL